MSKDKLADALRELGEAYNLPPETPRDEMWAVIQAALPAATAEAEGIISLDGERARRRATMRPAVPLAVAAAALLVLGFGLGRMTVMPGGGSGGGGAVVAKGSPSLSSGRVAAFQHLERSESLLSLVSADAKQGRLDPQVGEWGRGLLVETRLLLDSPSVTDPSLRELLEDLELILAQVALLSEGRVGGEGRAREELRLVAEGLEERDVLSRIQAVRPAGLGLTTM